MKDINFIPKIQGATLTVLCSIFRNKVTVYKGNQRGIVITVSLKIRSRTKHIAIKYHHFQSFIINGDIEIKRIDTKEQIADIFTKTLDSELFKYLNYNFNSWQIIGILIYEGGLILHALGGYLSRSVIKWLTQEPDTEFFY